MVDFSKPAMFVDEECMQKNQQLLSKNKKRLREIGENPLWFAGIHVMLGALTLFLKLHKKTRQTDRHFTPSSLHIFWETIALQSFGKSQKSCHNLKRCFFSDAKKKTKTHQLLFASTQINF